MNFFPDSDRESHDSPEDTGPSAIGVPEGGLALLDHVWSASARVEAEPKLGRAIKRSLFAHVFFIFQAQNICLLFP